MSWEIALQSLTAIFAAIGGWFVYDLITEFKSFKKDTHADIISLKLERTSFQATIRNAELSIGMRVNDMQKLHNDFSLEVKSSLLHFANDTKNFQGFMQKNLDVLQKFNEQLKVQDKELKTLKIQLGEVMLFKSQKNGK